ncbi:hypothetical protein DEU56DRAFT_758019, partial [Suillus clintonianus]|uniref:uncharacterized protein n=1 Tax=Suillus clintonianus TaxID=1904413 RepID=UPI001B86F08C
FVDRDMLMRFRGGGVGHRTTREATDGFLDDRDPLDVRHASAAVVSNQNKGAEGDESNTVDYVEGSATQGKAIELDEGDSDQPDSDNDDYGYSGIQQEIEGEDLNEDEGDGEDDEVVEGNVGDEIDDELGAEDGEDSDEELLEGFSEF